MGYVAAVDLGTSFTTAAVERSGEPTRVVPLSATDDAIPSVVFVDAEATTSVGHIAVEHGRSEPHRVATAFKRRIGGSDPVLLDGVGHSVEDLSAMVLRWVIARLTERCGEPPTQLVLTHPSGWGSGELTSMRTIAASCGHDEVTLVADLDAAAAHRDRCSPLPTGSHLAIVDFGGGGFQAGVFRQDHAGLVPAGEPCNLGLGGIDLDHLVLFSILNRSGLSLAASADTDPRTPVDLALLAEACTNAKVALSSQEATTVLERVGSTRREVPLSRSQLDDAIGPALHTAVATLEHAMESAGIEAADLADVMALGGSSQIPLFAEMLGAALGRTVAVAPRPKTAIVSGAIHAATRTTIAEDPPTPPPEHEPTPTASAASLATTDREPEPATRTVALAVRASPARDVAPRNPQLVRSRVLLGAGLVATVLLALAILSTRSNNDDDVTRAAVDPIETAPTNPRATPTARAIEVRVPVGEVPLTPVALKQRIFVTNAESATVSVIDAKTRAVIDTVPVSGQPGTPLASGGFVWVPSEDDSVIDVIDAATLEVVASVPVGDGPRTPVEASSLIWVPNEFDDSLTVIAPSDFSVIGEVSTGAGPFDPLVASGRIWVPNRTDGTMTVIDPARREVVATIDVAPRLGTPVEAAGLIWVASRSDNTLTAIDPVSLQVAATVAIGDQPGPPIVFEGLIWLPDLETGLLRVIDPVEGAVTIAIAVGDRPHQPTPAAGRLWVPNGADGTVSIIDPASFEVVDTIEIGTQPIAGIAVFERLWFPDQAEDLITVIDPTA